ncbi:NUDIX hydrolase [Cohnella silvisoli]|uniref:NUDIX domain-containing protein n=1 Tax=Cohnella silvisoli TaxID=2873699 RepID=A0ABV1KM22_9BACL|nr:NUDIX domain-containing protein [Cohnella silvisoli]MCD9020518.1 NUDIX domain-containing protein [Cohnella silvisoli]
MAEFFDVYDERGNWTGTAERSEVHARGLWHHTVHCWLVRPDKGEVGDDINGSSGAKILFQQRSGNKDTNPGSFDITAAGHLEAGESPKDVVRELEEELGARVAFEQLVEFGIIREEESGEVGGVPYIDAEVSHVYGLVTSLSLMEFQLQEEEVSGLYEADADDMIALMEGKVKEVTVQGVQLREGELQAAETVITCSSFVSRDYGYYIAIFKFLRDLAVNP